ncbi:MAG: alpha-L-fucosidase [Pirellulales bacterium]|nr:alpha-L-fucosidase [Pirellulales bacterium]
MTQFYCLKLSLLLVGLALLVSPKTALGEERSPGPYRADWESLRQHTPAPEWFRDAKFGIYFHWGVYSVPSHGSEWYPRHMHLKDHAVYKHHLATYGSPDKFGYHDMVPLFKAENFDADEWAELFQKAGARFAGPVAEHHDGFAMWDSALTPWNAAQRGPQRDITGEIAAAVRSRGMKLITSFHHARNSQFASNDQKKHPQGTGHYPRVDGWPTSSSDPDLQLLYGGLAREEFLERMWLGKLKEVIDKYHPDIIWFDSWLHEIPEGYRQEFLAYYLNSAFRREQEVVVTYKQEDLPLDIGVLDIEKGGMADLNPLAWLTDDTISLGSWCYTRNLKIKSTRVVLHSLIDIVSKNGQLLLNVSPMADGTIPENQRQVLLGLGEWLETYGEAIYETRPFVTYGHGPTTTKKGHFGGIALDKSYTAEDVRYTRKGDVVYAIVLGKLQAGSEVVLQPFAKASPAAKMSVQAVSLVGSKDAVEWQHDDLGLKIITHAEAPNEDANVFKIICQAS